MLGLRCWQCFCCSMHAADACSRHGAATQLLTAASDFPQVTPEPHRGNQGSIRPGPAEQEPCMLLATAAPHGSQPVNCPVHTPQSPTLHTSPTECNFTSSGEPPSVVQGPFRNAPWHALKHSLTHSAARVWGSTLAVLGYKVYRVHTHRIALSSPTIREQRAPAGSNTNCTPSR
jgi:hypothetical protein